MANQTFIGEERISSVELTREDLSIFFHNLGDTARHAMRTEFCEDGDLTADQRVLRRLRKIGRDGSAARLHIVDRSTQGLDDGDWQEVAYGYLYGSPS